MAAKKPPVAVDENGQEWTVVGNKWVPAVTGGPPMTNPDRTRLNTLGEQAIEGNEIKQQYRDAAGAIKRLKPGPYRAAFLDAAIPEENGGWMDRIGSMLIGGPARAIGAITPQEVDDFKRLKGLQSQRVLSAQIQQKGPQTESDAARMQMTEISPYKTEKVNNDVIRSGLAKAERVSARAPFYTQWANKYGLNALNEKGQSVDQAFLATQGGGAAPKRRFVYDPKTGTLK